jgi:hypothetical protein
MLLRNFPKRTLLASRRQLSCRLGLPELQLLLHLCLVRVAIVTALSGSSPQWLLLLLMLMARISGAHAQNLSG